MWLIMLSINIWQVTSPIIAYFVNYELLEILYKIIGYDNVPGRVAKDASSLYAKNIVNFLSLIIGNKDKKITIDWEDEIIKAVVLTHEGNLKLEQFK